MTPQHYSPNRVIVIVGGVQLMAPADGTFVEITRQTDAFSLLVGANGDPVFIQSHDQSGVITWRGIQGTPTNDYLQSLADADELDGSGGRYIQMEDANGNQIAHSELCHVRKKPDLNRATDHTPVEWVFLCGKLDLVHGSNTR